jgi:hypothetical protein
VRTIKLFAVIGLAVALVAVPALAQVQYRYGIEIKVQGDKLPNDVTLGFKVDQFELILLLRQGSTAEDIAKAIVDGIKEHKGPGNPEASGNRFFITAQQITIGGQVLQPQLRASVSLPPGNPLLTFTVVSLPTLTEWGLIALAVLLAGGMGYMIYRRRPALRPAAP